MASNGQLYVHGLVFIILPVFLGLVLMIFYMLFKKFHFKFEPVHMFMLNYFGTLALYMFSGEISALLMIFPASEDVCWQYLLSLFASMTFSFSILCMQADRFLAILWSIHYKARVTPTRAVTACCLSYLLSIIGTCGMRIFVQSYTNCVFQVSLLYTRPSNIAMEGIPRILAVVATIVVAIYAIIVDRQLAKLQPGPVSLPSNSQRETCDVRRINSDPNVFFLTESYNMDNGNSVMTPLASTSSFPEMLKNTTITNIINLVFLITFPMTVILGIAYTNCDNDAGGCDNYIFIYRCLTPLSFICLVISLILFLIRLR
jgi:hypothetical protein